MRGSSRSWSRLYVIRGRGCGILQQVQHFTVAFIRPTTGPYASKSYMCSPKHRRQWTIPASVCIRLSIGCSAPRGWPSRHGVRLFIGRRDGYARLQNCSFSLIASLSPPDFAHSRWGLGGDSRAWRTGCFLGGCMPCRFSMQGAASPSPLFPKWSFYVVRAK